MTWSQAEVAALAGKAARGAGAPPEQAARFGQAAAFHLAGGGDGVLLLAALEALPGGPIIDMPRLLDASVARAAQGEVADFTVGASLPKALVESYLGICPYSTSCAAGGDGQIIIRVDVCTLRPVGRAGRIAGCDRLIAGFSELAARTLVPETAASRQRGAGGASDASD